MAVCFSIVVVLMYAWNRLRGCSMVVPRSTLAACPVAGALYSLDIGS